MIRYYLDSNIYRLIKPEHPYYNSELRATADSSKGKVLFVFSDAHLDDLKPSINPYRDADLIFMGEYVSDNYFALNLKLEFECYLADPLTAFNGKDYSAVDDFYNNPTKIETVFDALEDIPETQSLKNIFRTFLDSPLNLLSPMIEVEKMESESKSLLLKYMPNYSSKMTLKDFWNNNMQYSVRFKDDKKELRDLRRFISKSFDRDKYSWEKWQQGFNSKFKETNLNKTFLEMIDSMLLNDQKKHLYRQITYAYSLLELYNITQERTSKGLKQFTFASLYKDATHVYFASFCDYLVTDDQGMQVKAFIIYQLFGIHTQVLSTTDFINRNHVILGNEETYETFIQTLFHDIRHAMQLFSKSDILTDKKIDTYKTTHVYFNYFNRMQLVYNREEKHCVLYCERNQFSNLFLFREIELITEKLLNIFGLDDDIFGKYDMSEKAKVPYIRKWTINGINFRFMVADNERGNYLALVLNYIEKS